MPFYQIYLLTAAGIALSILIPMVKKLIQREDAKAIGAYWAPIKPYVVISVFSLLTALLVVALAGNSLQDWRAAILAGYAWDSTLQKIGT